MTTTYLDAVTTLIDRLDEAKAAEPEVMDALDYLLGLAEAAPTAPSPGLVSGSHPETSRAAAVEVTLLTGSQRFRVLTRLAEQPSTRDELAGWLELTPNTVRPRLKECIDQGWACSNGETRLSDVGTPSEVMTATVEGRLALVTESRANNLRPRAKRR